MEGKYQKFHVKMNMEKDSYRLWKNGADEAICILETYKDKRSIYFSGINLLPSRFLQDELKSEYHLLLIGTNEEGIIHKDFGAFQVNQNGEGSIFKKFSGPALDCYTHCLLTAVDDQENANVIYRGETPFFVTTQKEQRENSPWGGILDLCNKETRIDAFTRAYDETNADWYRVENVNQLPGPITECREWIETYHHYILGKHQERYYVGIPGRFLQKEQPCRHKQTFLLWQPIRGGETFFECPEKMTRRQQDDIFGYWIAEIDLSSGELKPL